MKVRGYNEQQVLQSVTLGEIPLFHLISCCGGFAERHSFHIVSGDSPETM